jgi:type IV pilus assembly protein PilY1
MTMKKTRHLITLVSVLVCFIVLILPFPSHADDTAVYDISQNVKPNVLIIFDNSTSMNDGVPYDDAEVYTPLTYATSTIYERTCIDRRWWGCAAYGWVISSMTLATFEAGDADDDGIYDSDSTIRKGNRLNFDGLNIGRKIDVAKVATKQIIDDTYQFVRLGVMVLNGNLNSSNANYFTDTSVLSTANGGAQIKQWDNAGGATDKDILRGYIDATSSGSLFNIHWTPLANRLIAAAQYFKHADSATYGNFGTTGGFADPISSSTWCRKNYVIIVTDGLPTHEGDTKSDSDDAYGEFDYIEGWFSGNGVSANYDGNGNDPNGAAYDDGGSDYLDDVAKYLYDTDLRPDICSSITQCKQNITTFTIGFTVAHDLLRDTAENGHGEYHTAFTPAELEQALTNVMATIIDRAQTFTAPVVPVQRTTSGDKMYISLFIPRSTGNFWPGYLVKLKIGSNGELMGFSDGYGSGTEIQVTDSDGVLNKDLLKSDGPPYPFWDAQYELKQRGSERDIYTYLGNSYDLNDDSNKFVTGNTTYLTATVLGGPVKQASANPLTSARDDLINYFRGADAYNEDGDSGADKYTEKKEYILGDILHSKPLIIDYEASNPTNPRRVIYVGTNDGMLHAFDDTNGSEKWAFIPPDLLPKLKNMVQETGHQYYVDGSPQAYILDNDHDGNIETPDQDGKFDKVIIIFGERRGGTSYCALDVTNPDDPQYLWRIDKANSTITGIPNPTMVISELGQSWSEPVIGKVKVGTTDTIVAIIGGGYATPENSGGRALYLINVLNGSLVKSFTSSDHANLTKSIPSTVLAVDTNFDGYINRVYVGDVGGQMWRFGNQTTGVEDGNVNNWTARRLFYESTLPNPKIFYPPDMVLEPGYAYLYFGTGDREDPMDMTDANGFYALKDKNVIGSYTTLVETNLVNVTSDQLQDPDVSETDKQTIRSQLATGNGWYITLSPAEKVLAPPTVISGLLLFTTFTPVNTVANPCSLGGDARLYIMDYLTAVSVRDLDADGDIDKNDLSENIGQGIPTEVVVTITETGETRGYIGAGGGIIEFELTGSVRRFNIDAWREEF